jgi:hypothetical protein
MRYAEEMKSDPPPEPLEEKTPRVETAWVPSKPPDKR